jgi:DNA (cytosine-5)-methyltransferase 1
MERRASVYAKRLRGIDADLDDRARPREWDPQQLTASMRTGHELTTIARFEATAPGDSEEKSRFYRLDGAGLCSTIRAGTGYERGSFMAPRPIHPTRPRVISPREAARLHSFPDWFRFHVTKWHAFRQIGNSLPPLLARAIGQEVVRALDVTPTRFTKRMPLGDAGLLSLDTRGAAKYFDADIDLVPSHKRRHRKSRAIGNEGEVAA